MRYLRWLLAIFSPGRIIFVATIVAAAYLTFTAGHSLLHSYQVAGDESRLRQDVDQLQQQQSELQQIRDYLRTDQYVEFMARRVFGLVEPGETLVVVKAPPSDTPTPDPASESDIAPSTGGAATDAKPELSWWQRLFGE